jgi:hypothetical protein
MERVSDVQTLATRLGPVIYARNRRAALKRAGIILDPAIPAKVRAALSQDPLGLEGRVAAATTAGPTVAISITTGTPTARRSEPGTINGFDVVGTVFLASFEEILAKLWEALVYPQDVTPGDVAKLFDVDRLRSTFTGVPEGAQLGPMFLPTPPRLRVVAPDAVELSQSLRAQLIAPGGGIVELVAVAAVRIPLVLSVARDRFGVELNTILRDTRVSLLVDPASALQPRDSAQLEVFAAEISPKLAFVMQEVARKLDRSPVFEVPGGFTESKLRIVTASLWLSTWNQEDQVTFGLLVEPEPEDRPRRDAPSADKLAPLARLVRPDTIAITATESLVERGLRAVVASGQLADRINEKLEWLRNFELPSHVEVESVDVRFDDGAIKVGLDCSYLRVCAFATDFDFRATVDLRPEIVDSTLRLPSNGIDLDLDNVDTVLCLLTSPLTGVWGFILLTIGSLVAAVSSTSFNKRTPGFWQGERLPDSDVFPRIDLGVVGWASSGILALGGTFWLAPDEASTFVATRILSVSETTGEVTIVEGARVDLAELGAPPPAGDDYVVPDDFTGGHVEDDGTIVEIRTKYDHTLADQMLATATSERHGLARFAVQLDDAGGVIDVTTKRTTPAGPAFTTHSSEIARGDAPDLAVSVTLADGYRPVERKPIATNLVEHRAGTVQEPIEVVYVDRCIAERRAVTSAEAKVAGIQADLQELRAEYDRAPPSEKDAILRGIRRMEKDFLQPAIAAKQAALAAREACRAAG